MPDAGPKSHPGTWVVGKVANLATLFPETQYIGCRAPASACPHQIPESSNHVSARKSAESESPASKWFGRLRFRPGGSCLALSAAAAQTNTASKAFSRGSLNRGKTTLRIVKRFSLKRERILVSGTW